MPFSVMIQGHGTLEELHAVAAEVKRTMQLEIDGPLLSRLLARLRRRLTRAPLRLGWVARQALLLIKSTP